jgi:hypothetical protein
MSILSGRKVETPAPGSVGTFGGWRDPKELESLADHAYRFYGRETSPDELEQRDGVYVNRKDGTLLVKADDPLGLPDPGVADIEAWFRDDAGVITFLRRPRRNEPQSVTALDHKLAADKRATVDAEKMRRKFLADQTLQPAMRKTDGASMTLRAAIQTVENLEGRIELGLYGEVQVLLPPVLTAPVATPPSLYASDPYTRTAPSTIRSTRRRQDVTPMRRSR